MGRAVAKERMQIICDRFEKSLNEAAGELKGNGFRKATGFAEDIKKQYDTMVPIDRLYFQKIYLYMKQL